MRFRLGNHSSRCQSKINIEMYYLDTCTKQDEFRIFNGSASNNNLRGDLTRIDGADHRTRKQRADSSATHLFVQMREESGTV